MQNLDKKNKFILQILIIKNNQKIKLKKILRIELIYLFLAVITKKINKKINLLHKYLIKNKLKKITIIKIIIND